MGTTSFYPDDLAYVHDTGHGDFARGAAPALLGMLRRAGIVRGPVVDSGARGESTEGRAHGY